MRMKTLSTDPGFRVYLRILWMISFLICCRGQKTRFLKKYSAPQDAVIGLSFTFNWTYVLAAPDTLDGVELQYSTSFTLLLSVASDGTPDYSKVPASYKGRVTWTGDLKKSVVSFVLSNIALGDETSYNINIMYSSFNRLQNSVILKVLEPAYFEGSPLLNQSLIEGQDLTLKCEAGGRPQPNITWVDVSNGQVVQKGKGSSTLQINKIARPSSSAVSYVYECQAVNIHGRAAIKKKTWITVQYAPEGTTLITNAVSDTVDKGDDVTLTCGATGAVPAVDQYKFYFEKDGTWTNVADRKQKTHQITDVKGSDQGKYKCVPHNSVGDGQEATVKLTVKVPVNITDITNNQTVKEGKSFQLNCKADGQPAPTITWTKAGKQLFHSTTYVVSKSKRNDSGEYVCTAVNQHSKDTASVHVIVQYKAKIVTASSSTNTSSYIGQKITLTCVAEGVPVPTLEWIKPGGSPLKPGEQSNRIAVDVDFKTEADFGPYKCSAKNILAAADVLTIYINQLKKPGQPIVTFSDEDIQASSLTIKWSSPADDGGSGITGYRVSVPEAAFNKSYLVSDTGKETPIGPFKKNTNYTLLVYARNVVGEGQPAKESFTTKYEGAPELVTATDYSTKDPHIFTVRWTEPINNGAEVEGYDIYKRESGTDEWVKVQTLNKDARSFNISLSPGASYQIVVTATNKFGESIKENWVTIDIPPVTIATTLNIATTKGDTSGEEKAVGDRTGSGMIIGVAVGAVLFAIIAVALGFMIWRKSSHQGGKGYGSVTSRGVLSADDEGYESVSRRAAVQNLGARRDGAYADAGGDSSVYAQVDKSKKNPKKPKRKPGEPGELVYADLADFSRPRGGAVPVRPEEIQRSDYADITQFSAPKQEPTYDNLPRADATYANVQGM